MKHFKHYAHDTILITLIILMLHRMCMWADLGSRGWAATYLILLMPVSLYALAHFLMDAYDHSPRAHEAIVTFFRRLEGGR